MALQYLADARIITGPFHSQVCEVKLILICVSTHSPYLSHRCFCWQQCWFPDLDDSMTRSAGRWSPFAALTTSPTATWLYQPHASRGRERRCGSCTHRAQKRMRRGGKKGGMERTTTKKKKTETNGKHIRGERQSFQFQGDEKSTMISPVWSEGMIGHLFSYSQNHFAKHDQVMVWSLKLNIFCLKKKKKGVEIEAIEEFFGKRSICNLKRKSE